MYISNRNVEFAEANSRWGYVLYNSPSDSEALPPIILKEGVETPQNKNKRQLYYSTTYNLINYILY